MKQPDPSRGVYAATCEACGKDGACRLELRGDRYLWICVTGCEAAS